MKNSISKYQKNNICGNNVKKFRKDVLKITQKELAKRLEKEGIKAIRIKYISDIECGKAKVSDIELVILAKVLGVNVTSLLSEDEW